MNTRRIILGLSALVVSAIGTLSPIAYFLVEDPRDLLPILALGGWTAACVVYVYHRQQLESIEQLIEDDYSPVERNRLQSLHRYFSDLRRYYRAGFAVQLERGLGAHEVADTLRRIATVAQHELPSQFVEIGMFDESSGRWSTTFVVGHPMSTEAQSFLSEETSVINDVEVRKSPLGEILIAPIQFSGTTLGVIRVEMRSGVSVADGDRNVIRLLANQCAVVLANGRFTEEMLRMKRLSDESVKSKTGFLANLSHEIRGPLAIVLNATELMRDGLCGELTPRSHETLKMIQSSGEHLLDLVNDVLDYAKVEAGKIVAKPGSLSVHSLLADLTHVVREQAVAKRQRLTLDPVDPTLGIHCDRRHARQMMINILTNAVKYTPEGGSIQVGAKGDGSGAVLISVADTGVGIPENQRERVFAAFERIDDEYSQKQVGTGLGMPLSKRLAETNGGDIEFTSEVGKGSTFFLRLPQCELPTTSADEASSLPGEAIRYGKGEGVLLVDAESDSRTILETFLTHQGFKVYGAANGREALSFVKSHQLGVALVDSDVGGASAEELIEVVRAHPRTASLPVALMSAKAFAFDVEQLLRSGVDRYLTKPVELRDVARTLRLLIDETGSSEPFQNEPPPAV